MVLKATVLAIPINWEEALITERNTICPEDGALARSTVKEQEALKPPRSGSIDETDRVASSTTTFPEPVEDLIIEEITIDGICGVY